jgi:hypothetical protein
MTTDTAALAGFNEKRYSLSLMLLYADAPNDSMELAVSYGRRRDCSLHRQSRMKWGTGEVPHELLMALFRYPLPEPDWTLSVSSGSPVPVSAHDAVDVPAWMA